MKNLLKPHGLSVQQVIALARKMFHSNLMQPLMLHGPPGIGKTDCAKRIAVELFKDLYHEEPGYENTYLTNGKNRFLCMILSAPLLDPTDTKGLPVIDHEKKLAYWLRPFFLPDAGPGLILIDDLPAALPAVANSLLTLLQHRRVMDYVLPANVMLMAAGNRAEDNADARPLSSAVNSRMTHIQFIPDFQEWTEWAYKNNIHPSVIAFLKWREGAVWFHSKPEYLAEESFACPRTWHQVSDFLHLDLSEDIISDVIAGCVGPAAAADFIAYRQVYNKIPDIKTILSDPLKAPVPSAPDELHAISSALAFMAKDPQNHRAILDYALRFGMDYQVKFIKDASDVNFDILLIPDMMSDGKISYGQKLKDLAKTVNKLHEYSK